MRNSRALLILIFVALLVKTLFLCVAEPLWVEFKGWCVKRGIILGSKKE